MSWQRRMRRYLFSFAVLFCVMVSSFTCDAADTKALYTLYGKEYSPKYPKGVSETIAKYDSAMRHLTMYHYIDGVANSSDILSARIKALKKELDAIKDKLTLGYFKEANEIYELEEKYSTLYKQYSGYMKTLQTFSVKDKSINLKDAPTYKEYYYALEMKKLYSGEHNLGSVHIKYPVVGEVKSTAKTKQGIKLKVSNAKVQSIFNGRVTNVSNNSVTVSHYDGIYSYYGNLHKIKVHVGDSVSQGSVLGTAASSVELRLMIDNEIVDIKQIFNED